MAQSKRIAARNLMFSNIKKFIMFADRNMFGTMRFEVHWNGKLIRSWTRKPDELDASKLSR